MEFLNSKNDLYLGGAVNQDEDISAQLKYILLNDSDLQNTLATVLSANTNLQNAILDKAYPVGSYYISHNSTSPATLFGGTWTRINNEFLYCMGDNANKPDDSSANLSVGATGGSATHEHTTGDYTLTVNEIPKHSHTVDVTQVDSNYGATTSGGIGYGGRLYVNGGTLSTSNTGGAQAHNHGNTGTSSNIPPYVAVYCWRRTA